MSVTIISEETLEKFFCANCYKYLSYGNAKFSTADNIICGRCDQSGCPQYLQTNEHFNSYLFPCVNRFDNCMTLLRHSDVPKHEKTCKMKALHFCNICDFVGNGSQLYHHYQKKHPDSLLKFGFLEIDLLNPQCRKFLSRKNNNLFKIEVNITKVDLNLNMGAVGYENQSVILKYNLILESMKRKQICYEASGSFFKNKPNNTINIEIPELHRKSSENTFVLKFDFVTPGDLFTLPAVPENSQLDKLLSALKTSFFPKLICVNCGSYSVIPVLICSANHVKCPDCRTAYCKSCEDVQNWIRAQDLEAFHMFIPFPCRFCSQLFLAQELRNHEKLCHKRTYNCLEKLCTWRGGLEDMIKHGHNFKILVRNGSMRFYGYQEGFNEGYIIFDLEVFYIRIDPLRMTGRNAHIRKISDVNTNTKYTAKVKMIHKCDGKLMSFSIPLLFGGITKIARSNFERFRECKQYKILVTVELDVTRDVLII